MTDKIREIYRKSFGEDKQFENLLFEACADYLKTLEIGKETVSFLFALPCEIKMEYKTFKAAYIFAAATDKNHRKKGYMTSLLERVKGELDCTLLLRPASDSLIKFYKSLGFAEFTAQDSKDNGISLVPLKGFKDLTDNEEKSQEGEFTAMAFNSPVDLENLYFPHSMP